MPAVIGPRKVRQKLHYFGKIADDSVCKEFNKLLTKLNLKRPGLSFYALRHTFETIGGACRDQVAVDAIMGHSGDDMASVCRGISDERLRAVVDNRRWRFGDLPETAKTGENTGSGGTAATAK